MTKTYPYHVIWRGEIIPPNTPIEVEDEEKPAEATEKPKKGAKKNDKSGIDEA